MVLVFAITVSKAQQPSSANQNSPAATAPVVEKASPEMTHNCSMHSNAEMKDCGSMSKKECKAHSDAAKASSASESMSSEHTNSGSADLKSSCENSKAGKKGNKSCCSGASRTSSVAPQVQSAGEAPKQ